MDVSDIAAYSTVMANATTDYTVGIAVLRKALLIEQQAAVQLIKAIPQMGASVDPAARLGQNIDVKA